MVDNNSTDGTSALVRSMARRDRRFRLLSEKTPGSPAARNRGAQAARGSVLVFTDADCTFAPDWLAKITAPLFMENPRLPIGAVGGLTKSAYAKRNKPNLWEEYSDRLFRDWESDRREPIPGFLPWAPTCNLAVKRELFLALGGFESAWRVAAYDVDLCWRLQLAGFALEFAPKAIVHHRRRDSLLGVFKQMRGYGFYNAQLLRNFEASLGFSHWSVKRERWRARFHRWKGRASLPKNRKAIALKLVDGAASVVRVSAQSLGGLRPLEASIQHRGFAFLNKPGLGEPWSRLHSQGWCYWRSEDDLVLYQPGKKLWYRMNPSAWSIWEAKSQGASDEAIAADLGQKDSDAVLDDIANLTLDLKSAGVLA